MSDDLVRWVCPLQGSDSRFSFSYGNCYPLVAMPHGLTYWTPQTDEGGFLYDYRQPKLQGIRATHQPSPWMDDFGHFTIMPFVGEVQPTAQRRSSGFSHEQEEAGCDRYALTLLRYRTRVEVTATERCGVFRIQFPTDGDAGVAVQTIMGESQLNISGNEITGYTRGNHGGCPANFACYFVMQFDSPVTACGTFGEKKIEAGAAAITGERVGCYVRFDAAKQSIVGAKIATSFISVEQARENLRREVGDAGFDAVRAAAGRRWNELLGRFSIEGADETQRRTFYSAVYRALLFPCRMHEITAQGATVHYSPYDGRVHDGVMYTNISFWDTHRTLLPLLTLAYPDLVGEVLQGFVAAYQQSGWIPGWATPGQRGGMVGTHGDVVFADAIIKGIGGFDHGAAYEAIAKNAFTDPPEGTSLGRGGLADYARLGYVPADRWSYSGSRTLDYAYCDYAIAQAAARLGKEADARTLGRRAGNYRNLWDPSVGFMRGRNSDGSWLADFDPFRWGGPFIEGSAWQYSWNVPHDPLGLAELAGGPAKLIARLDEMLAIEAGFDVGDYGHEIHEMTEMALAGFGQYAHSNQPVHHVLWMYTALGERKKTAHWTREVMRRLYHPGPSGLPGDEDNGEMSAWYVLAAMGFYPLCLASGRYALGQPLFERITLQRPGAKGLVIQGGEGAVSFDGKPLADDHVEHAQLAGGGTLSFGE